MQIVDCKVYWGPHATVNREMNCLYCFGISLTRMLTMICTDTKELNA